MPSAKGPGEGVYSTILRQATSQTPKTSESAVQADSSTPSAPETNAAKNPSLKLPQLRADERGEATTQPPANENNTLMLLQSWQRGKDALGATSKSYLPTIIMFCGVTLSAMWLAAAVVYVHNAVGWQNIKTLMPHEIGGFLAGLLAPVALFWMILTFWLRSVDVKLYAEALRGEIQRMIFPSEEAERRVNNDIDRLVKQTAEMSRATRMALGTLQQARQAMHTEAQALQNGVAVTAKQLEQLEERLGNRQQAFMDLHNKLDTKSQAFAQTGAQLLKDAQTLDQIITNTSAKTTQISETLQAPIKTLQNWQNDIVDTLNASLSHITDKQDVLRIDAKAIEEKALMLATTLQSSTDKLYGFTDDALDKAKIIETRLQGQGLSLQETLQQIATQAESLTQQRDKLLVELQSGTEKGKTELVAYVELLGHTTDQIEKTQHDIAAKMQTALQEASAGWTRQADQFNTVIQAGTTKTTEQLTQSQSDLQTSYQLLQRDVNYLTQSVQSLLEKAGDAWQEQAIQFDTTVQTGTAKATNRLTQSQAELQASYQALQNNVNQLTDAVQTALSQAGQTWQDQTSQFDGTMQDHTQRHIGVLTSAQSKLQQGYTLFQFDAENAIKRSTELLQTVQSQLQSLSETIASDVSQQHAQTSQFVGGLMTQYQTQTQTAAADLTRLQHELNSVATQLADRTQTIGHTGEQTAAIFKSLQATVEEGVNRISTTTVQLQNGLTTAQASLEEPLQKLEHVAQSVHDKAQIIGNVLDQRVTNLYELGGALTQQASMLGTDLTTKSQILENVLTRLQNDVRTINTDMVAQTEKLDNQIRVTFDQVKDLVPQIQTIQQNFVQTNAYAEKAEITLAKMNDTTLASSQSMLALSDDVVSRVTQSLTAYQQLQSQYQTLNDATLQQHTHLQDRHQQDLQRLQDSIVSAQDYTDKAGARYQLLQNIMQGLQASASQSQLKAVEATTVIQQAQQAMVQTSDQLQIQTDKAAQQIRVVQQILDGSAQSALSQVSNLSAAMQMAEKQTGVLQDKTGQLSGLAKQHANEIDHTVHRLEKAAQVTQQTFDTMSDVNSKISGLNTTLSNQATQLRQQHETLEGVIVTALTDLQGQTDKLALTVYDAGKQAESIYQKDKEVQREYFFNATKFIVESLHSLALDFTRMLDGELPEKTWKAYQRGDTSVFTKRLVSLRDTISHDKIRQKFMDDAEFRTYVQRYMRQFEEIYNHAKQQDHGDLLSGVFTSSDVGRLYQLLETILERN